MSDDSDDNIQISQVSVFPKNEIIVENEKISDVPENVRISLDEDTMFRFTCEVHDGFLHLKLSEIGTLCPFIYETPLSLDKMKQISSSFESCIDLDTVKMHINNLFNAKKIKLKREKQDTIELNITLYNLSKEENKTIELKRYMTTKKDKVLMDLYEIEKKNNKIFKDVKKFLEEKKLYEVLKKFEEIREKNLK